MLRILIKLLLICLFTFVTLTHTSDQPTKENPLNFGKDVGHIKEHLMEQYGFDEEKATSYLKEYDAQTQFFVMHDFDNNTKLDGLELLKSMTHFQEHDEEEHKNPEQTGERDIPDNTETLVEFVDMILKDQDYNKDGYIDYPEYISYYSKYDDDDKKESESN